MKGPQAVVVFGKVGREGLRGPGNSATVSKTGEGCVEGRVYFGVIQTVDS